MHSTFRTTERALHSLAVGGTKVLKRGGSNSGRSSGFNSKNFKRNFTKTIYNHHNIIRAPKIIINNVLVKQKFQPLSTKTLTNVSLINPKKAPPDDTKELITLVKPLTHPNFGKGKSSSDIPSVTKVLQATMPASSRFVLDRWKESMVKKLGFAGFQKYQKDTFERGHALHQLLANYMLGRGEPQEGTVELEKEITRNLWKSIQPVVRDKISSVRLVEHTVTHTDMNYRGIVDCVAVYDNELVVIDFKTAEKSKKTVDSLYDNPLQVSAYCGAINNDTSIPSDVIDRNICSGLVIVAYVDGSEASTYYLSKEDVANKYWKQWATRLDQFSRMKEMGN